ncbi:MAG: DUF4846 domain-containing protein [Ginsengibacter sp.]
MKYFLLFLTPVFIFNCNSSSGPITIFTDELPAIKQQIVSSEKFNDQSWQYFLQHLPVKKGIVVDYNGNAVANQMKQDGIVQFDVGKADLQQCADALMRIRAEYLFSQKRYDEIGFHFVNGHYYSYDDYCIGLRVMPAGKSLTFVSLDPCFKTHETLRKYLNIVYCYASTISLAKELKKTNEFAIGTVVIHPGSPGHCFIIVDEAPDSAGNKVFKLVEGYSPAQSIYVLSNLEEPQISPWYHLTKGTITTSSCRFIDYQMGKFE